MPIVIVVSNTSPLTSLAAIGYLALLPSLYERIFIPLEVSRELLNAPSNDPGRIMASKISWISIRPVANRDIVQFLLSELDKGEAEAIALARELHADSGLERIELLSVLRSAKHQGIIPVVKPILDDLMESAGLTVQRQSCWQRKS